MKLEEIEEVRQVKGQRQINAYLECGWILLSVVADKKDEQLDKVKKATVGRPESLDSINNPDFYRGHKSEIAKGMRMEDIVPEGYTRVFGIGYPPKGVLKKLESK